jgi:hypothetical protein
MRKVATLLALVALAGCWRDPADVAAEYEDAYVAAHADAQMGDAAEDTDVDGSDAANVQDTVNAVDAEDAPDVPEVVDDIVDKCAGKICTAKSECTPSVCYPATGECTDKPVKDGTICSADGSCLKDLSCQAGVCTGTPIDCNDNNPCTDDGCFGNIFNACQHLSNSATCTDDTICTSNDGCSGGACKGTDLVCNDNNPCTDDSCAEATGCVHAANSVTCTDGDACTSGDVCAGKACAGVKVSCEDGNVCTADSCDKGSGCVHTAIAGSCSDGDPCTLPDACSEGTCVGSGFGFGVHEYPGFGLIQGTATYSGKSWLVGAELASPSGLTLWRLLDDGSIGDRRVLVFPDCCTVPVGLIPVLATNGVWVIGRYLPDTPDSEHWPVFAWFGDDGTIASQTFSTAKYWAIAGYQPLGNQWLLAGTKQQAGEIASGWVGVATPKSGASPAVLLTSEWQPTTNAESGLNTLVALPGSTYVALGYIATASGTDPWLVALGASGIPSQDKSIHLGAGKWQVTSAIPEPDGGVLAIAPEVGNGCVNAMLIRLDANLNLLWKKAVAIGCPYNGPTLIAAPNGAFLVGTKGTQAIAIRFDEAGNEVWSNSTSMPSGLPWFGTGIARADGRFLAVGGVEHLGVSDDILQVSFDPFGSPTCTTTGKCTSFATVNPDDGNPCTLDQCDPLKGIIHSNVADGSWCDDGVACTVGDSCTSGTCIGGPRLFTKNYSGRTLSNLIPVSQGGFAECGATTTGAYITWVDAAGKQLADDVTTTMYGRGCAQGSDEAIWQAGTGSGGAMVRKLDLSTGKAEFTNSYGGGVFSCVIAHPDGGVVALGSKQPSPRVTRILADGSKDWEWLGSGIGDADNANDAVFLADGSLFVVGEKHASGGNAAPFAVLLDSKGNQLWSATFTVTTGRLMGAAIDPNGTLLAVGGQGVGGPGSGAWIVRIDLATGKVKDNLMPPSPSDTLWYDVAWFPPAPGSNQPTAFLVGSAQGQAVFVRVGSDAYAGKPEALSAGNQGSAAAYRSVVLDPSGDVLVAGNTTQGQLARIDAWYHQTCTSAGKCLGVAPASCSDNNTCTGDDCDSAIGCKYSPGPSNSPCPGGTCQNGVCK